MVELLIAILVALGNGATALRVVPPADTELWASVVVEYTTPTGCTNMADEPCYVIVGRTSVGAVNIETGP